MVGGFGAGGLILSSTRDFDTTIKQWNIPDPDSHPADTRLTATLAWFDGDSVVYEGKLAGKWEAVLLIFRPSPETG
ncbi:MAG: hypothetical protein ACJAQT_004021 [Akkermansiaceae bacterium]